MSTLTTNIMFSGNKIGEFPSNFGGGNMIFKLPRSATIFFRINCYRRWGMGPVPPPPGSAIGSQG